VTEADEEHSPQAEELAQLFRAYLNQDWASEYDNVWDAVRDFSSGHSAVAVGRAAEQVQRILEDTRDEARLESAVNQLGMEYYPPGEGWTYTAWLTELEKVLRSPRS
jgi:CdiI immunity protein